MKQTTLCFLLNDDLVLLAMKKRGFGMGKWNGVGGKVQPGESIEAAAIREATEEIGVVPTELVKRAELTFVFSAEKSDWNEVCHVFTTRTWEGEPSESEEMAPAWYAQATLPFAEMWEDDPLWLPNVLAGIPLTAQFSFDEQDRLLPDHTVTFLPTTHSF